MLVTIVLVDEKSPALQFPREMHGLGRESLW